MEEILNYIENPPLSEEKIIICGKDYGKTNFEGDTLKKMIKLLKKEDKAKLLNKVIEVCELWNTLKVAPNNCIGTIARYQLAKHFLEYEN